MSAAATAAGYLYASGRLRGRNAREGEEADPQNDKRDRTHGQRRQLKVSVYAPEVSEHSEQKPARPVKQPKIEYRTRRWRPNE
jgi:hypothetical protein